MRQIRLRRIMGSWTPVRRPQAGIKRYGFSVHGSSFFFLQSFCSRPISSGISDPTAAFRSDMPIWCFSAQSACVRLCTGKSLRTGAEMPERTDKSERDYSVSLELRCFLQASLCQSAGRRGFPMRFQRSPSVSHAGRKHAWWPESWRSLRPAHS